MKILLISIISFIVVPISTQAQLIDTLTQKVELLLNEYQIELDPGIALSVEKDGEIIYKRNKGYANLEHMIPITDSTKFVVGSISKQFTAFSILLLEEEGKLSIEDDITKYLPELKGLPYKVAIKHFLNHTSGFRNNTDLNSLKGRTDLDLTNQVEMVSLLTRQKGLNFVPGDKFQYCNSGYVLLAEVVERVSGISFSEFTKRRIFTPLKMRESLFLDDPSLVVKNKASSYFKQNNEYYYIPLNRSIVGSTGLYTTVRDLSLWANNFNDNTIGKKRIFKKMQTKSILNNGEVIPYSLGQELKVYKGLEVIFHGGGDAGFRSYLLRVPKHNLNIAITGNFEEFNPLNIAYGLIDIYLSNHIIEPIKKEIPTYANEELKLFEGDYQVFPGLYITILAEKDTLYFKSYESDEKIKLPVLKENEFDFTARPHSKFVFKNNSLNWHFSDFYYPANRVKLNPPIYADINLSELVGIYESDEVETSYNFLIADNKLIATHNFNEDIELRPIANDAFISDVSYIGRVEFLRNINGKIDGCKIFGQSSEVQFSKVNKLSVHNNR